MGFMKDFPCFFNIQVSSEQRPYLYLLKVKKYSSYITVPSEQMCKRSVTHRIAFCPHAVQQCGRKNIQGNENDVSDDFAILSDKTCK